MIRKVLKIETVDELNKLTQVHTRHTSVCVLDNPVFMLPEEYSGIKTGLYIILIQKTEDDCTSHGCKCYDFRELSLTFHAPGEKIEIREKSGYVKVIAFHPDLFGKSGSGVQKPHRSFFDYKNTEALHISAREKQTLWGLLNNLCHELRYGVDMYSRTLLATHVSLLLDYCTRFYQRQFYLRANLNKEILSRFDNWLDGYIFSSLPEKKRLPSYKDMAEMQGLSLAYFTDMLRIETGDTLLEHVQTHLIDMAKRRVMNKSEYLEDIAAELGFSNMQSFNRLFKKLTGYSPKDYRMQAS